MSRYTIPAYDTTLTIIVGWDNPLQTFFAQVYVPSTDPLIDDEEQLWIGACPGEIPTPAALQAQLARWGMIDLHTFDALLADQACAEPPTPFQQRMIRWFASRS